MKLPRNKNFKPTTEQIAAVIEMTKGRGGVEDETALMITGWERDTVEVMCGRGADAARMLRRVGSKVVHMHLTDDPLTVTLYVDASVFRGVEYAFSRVDNKSTDTFPGRTA